MQPIPKVARDDVIRVVQRDFPANAAVVLDGLREYGTEDWHSEEHRVHLAILKLSNGDVAQVAALSKIACFDYRDVLGHAEYPDYMRAPLEAVQVDKEFEEQIIERDWQQYQHWLSKCLKSSE